MAHWLNDLPAEVRERVFEVMREIREESDKALRKHEKLRPRYGEIAWGGMHMDPFFHGEGLAEYLRLISQGLDPTSAGDRTREFCREMIKKWNANPVQAAAVGGKYAMERWVGMVDHTIDYVTRDLLATVPTHQGDKKP